MFLLSKINNLNGLDKPESKINLVAGNITRPVTSLKTAL